MILILFFKMMKFAIFDLLQLVFGSPLPQYDKGKTEHIYSNKNNLAIYHQIVFFYFFIFLFLFYFIYLFNVDAIVANGK